MHEFPREIVSQGVENTIKAIGEDPTREGLLKTPERHAKAMEFLTRGYHDSVRECINDAIFQAPSNDMVIVRNIEFYSLCEHHLLPFFGKCHVGYLPKGRIIGLSKIPRIVNIFARRLQVQERLTSDIAKCLMEELEPNGVAVITDAQHFCMMMRGVEKQGASAKTSALLGDFQRPETRAEFFNLIK